MKKLSRFKNSLLMSAVALSVLSSPASAVRQQTVYAYWRANVGAQQPLDKNALNKLKELDRTLWMQFKQMVSSLANGMGEYDRALVITALGSISPDKWDQFKTISEALTEKMDGKNRAWVIRALSEVPSDRLSDPNFISAVNELTQNMDGKNRAWVIKVLGVVPLDRLSDPNFISTVKEMTEKMDGYNRAWVIKALGQVPSDKLADPNFISIAKALTENMEGYDCAPVIAALGQVPSDKLADPNFISIAKALTQNMGGKNRALVITALGKMAPKILFHRELPKGITVFLNMFDSVEGKVQAIQELGMYQDLFDSNDFSYYGLFQKLANQSSSLKNYHIVKALCQIREDKINNPQFLTIAGSLTQNMGGKNCALVIRALVELPDDKLSDLNFIPKITVLTENMNEANRASASLMLLTVPVEHREKFMSIVGRLTKNMDGKDRRRVISTLVRVKQIHKNRVYGQLQRFVEETTGKMTLRSSSALELLIGLFSDFDTEGRAITFTTNLITHVKGAPGTVDDQDLTKHMKSAWAPKSSTSLYEFTKLTRKRNNPEAISSGEEVPRHKKTRRIVVSDSEDD